MIKKRALRWQVPEGVTDSEQAFLWLLEELADTPDAEFSRRLKELADEIRDLGSFNFLMSDGQVLWAYAEDSLYFLHRVPPYGGELVQLRDDGYSIRLSEVKAPDERAVLIATDPLTNEAGWEKLNCGELLVVRAGRVEQRLAD